MQHINGEVDPYLINIFRSLYICLMLFVVFFFCQFCNVAKVAMTHVRIFSQIWLQYKYEIKIFKTSFYIFALHT